MCYEKKNSFNKLRINEKIFFFRLKLFSYDSMISFFFFNRFKKLSEFRVWILEEKALKKVQDIIFLDIILKIPLFVENFFSRADYCSSW